MHVPLTFPAIRTLQVRQLHVHITARMVDDPSWPGPCYGAVPAKPLDQVQAQELLENIRIALHSSSRT